MVLLALLAIAAIAAYRFLDWDFNWSLFLVTLRQVHPGWLAASVAATLVSYIVRAFRWQVLLANLKHIPLGTLTGATIVGFSAIYVLGRAGELVRPIWLTRREQTPFSSSVATIVAERFLDSLLLIVVFAAALFQVEVSSAPGTALAYLKEAAWLVVATSAAAVVLLIAFHSNVHRIVRYIPFSKAAALLNDFAKGLSFLGSGRSLAWALAHSALLWLLIVLQFWFLLRGMNFEFSAAAASLVLVVTALGSVAQIPGVGGGFQAGFAFAMATFFLVPAETAIAASLIAWVFSYAPTVLVAVAYLLIQGETIRGFRTLMRNPQSAIL